MISEQHRVVFLHVPKCAGISMRMVLRQCHFQPVKLGEHVEGVEPRLYRRGAAARLARHVDRQLWEECFKFSVCRNPYDRLVSGWSFLREKGQLAPLPFEYFARNLRTFESFWIEWHCTIPQRRHVSIDGVPVIDYACRFENLEEDLRPVRERIGEPRIALPRLNFSTHEPYREYYTKELQDIVYERFKEDFEFFGYGYEL